jgi:hypothetical protein
MVAGLPPRPSIGGDPDGCHGARLDANRGPIDPKCPSAARDENRAEPSGMKHQLQQTTIFQIFNYHATALVCFPQAVSANFSKGNEYFDFIRPDRR